MSLIKWNRDQFLPDFTNVLNELFDDDFFSKGKYMPAVNIKDNTDDYHIEVAAPGLDKGDFKISLDDDVLTISSEKKSEHVENSEESQGDKPTYTRREFSYQSFSRSFTLPKSVKHDDISANYNNGVLSIVVPKEEASKEGEVKTIDIS
ncbi:Hsp20/alpha crystallin family protein [Microscilla marina]|uniref:Small heat shock protein n=1 Tax=Microscilla marina ATCC 23134 TaxID=313606 RepID=A1ZJ14_MICM2|nr:Hsp20/alpha crystallin family protein [Microscilla marina]EAY29550.1 small heat shock protein [Microscilla marina ATCC 23134]